MTAVLLAVLLQVLPDRELTPGVVRPLTTQAICATKWGMDRRHVTEAMKRHVFRAYGIAWERRSEYEIDHVVPRSLGGADDILDLWPQAWAGEWGARRKDRLEIALSRAVCAGRVPLKTAQDAFRGDWTEAYRTYIGDPTEAK